jgi:hypothetical protein
MSGAFPLTPSPSGIKIQSLQPTRVSLSHNLRRSVRTTGAQRWLVTADWVGLTRAQFAPIQAFVIAQRGQTDSFTMVLPGHKQPQGVATGTPLVNGATQSGRALATKGWSASVTGLLKAGDFIGIAGQTKVYMVTADASSDASGNATLTIEPGLMSSPADGAALVVRNVPFTLALAGDSIEMAVSPPVIYNFSLPLVEAF